ncbi:hypothetical protein BS78_K070400 [Paspalum vaginatum]|uniref:Uncharacterized protein n=1 Tax=Paspalum vaginatum TaxID=158149 RepID=A0A9W7XF20_9POAL|nr:hypothetical protein BS78_K070400 [Paspalum vaginatum]KAJ1257388.1 hypothetical protein BS78_K070400 [Paspalum vaginatum]
MVHGARRPRAGRWCAARRRPRASGWCVARWRPWAGRCGAVAASDRRRVMGVQIVVEQAPPAAVNACSLPLLCYRSHARWPHSLWPLPAKPNNILWSIPLPPDDGCRGE